MRLSYARLLVEDFASCFRFYRDTMDLPVLWGEEDGRYAEFDAGEARLAIAQRGVIAQVVGTKDREFALPEQDRFQIVFEVDDVDKVAARLRDAGAQQVNAPEDLTGWGVRAAHFRDPDGYLIEINQAL